MNNMYCNKNKNESHYMNESRHDSKLKGNPCCTSIPNESLAGSCIPITKFTVDTTCLRKKYNAFQFISCISTKNFIGSITFKIFRLTSNKFKNVLVGNYTFTKRQSSSTSNIPLAFFITNDLCNTDDKCVTYSVIATISTSGNTSGNLTLTNIRLITDPNFYEDFV